MIRTALAIATRVVPSKIAFAILGGLAATQLHSELTALGYQNAAADVAGELLELRQQLEQAQARIEALQRHASVVDEDLVDQADVADVAHIGASA